MIRTSRAPKQTLGLVLKKPSSIHLASLFCSQWYWVLINTFPNLHLFSIHFSFLFFFPKSLWIFPKFLIQCIKYLTCPAYLYVFMNNSEYKEQDGALTSLSLYFVETLRENYIEHSDLKLTISWHLSFNIKV